MSDQDVADAPTWHVVGVLTFYTAVALIMVMTNKWVLNNFPLPLTFIFAQLIISVLCLRLLALMPAENRFRFRPPRWTANTLREVGPVSMVGIAGLLFNTFCLSLVDASYFQVARGLSLPMTVMVSRYIGNGRISGATIVSCGLVTWGYLYNQITLPFLGRGDIPPVSMNSASLAGSAYQDGAPALGMLLGAGSAAMLALHTVMIKSVLTSFDGRTMELAYWQNLLQGLVLLPGIALSGELSRLGKLFYTGGEPCWMFAMGSGITGLVGFLICIAGLWSIKITSPITHMFSSAMRSVLQTLLGIWFFKELLTTKRLISILLIVLGGMLYTWSKSRPARSAAGDSAGSARYSGTNMVPMGSEKTRLSGKEGPVEKDIAKNDLELGVVQD